MDGSSFVEKGERKAGYAVVSLEETKESGSLPPDTSAQKAELFALTRALESGEGRRIQVYKVYTESILSSFCMPMWQFGKKEGCSVPEALLLNTKSSFSGSWSKSNFLQN